MQIKGSKYTICGTHHERSRFDWKTFAKWLDKLILILCILWDVQHCMGMGCAYIYIYIYIFTPFLTQCFLKLWWPWTYQNSAIKRASARVVPGWVTSWEAKNIVSLGWVVTNGIRIIVQPEMGGCAQAHEGRQWALVGTPRMGWSHEGYCDVSHRLGMTMCLYVYSYPSSHNAF
jgi:hypothetical protein